MTTASAPVASPPFAAFKLTSFKGILLAALSVQQRHHSDHLSFAHPRQRPSARSHTAVATVERTCVTDTCFIFR